jgi:uncharacterized LabA/DUF88 family protein
MANFCYVDNSNVWIEGMHVSAVVKGLAPDVWAACDNRICDYDWAIDFGRLFGFAAGSGGDVGRAVLFGSRPPKNDSLWAMAESKGFEVIVHDRNAQNKEKKIDTQITAEMIEDSFTRMKAGDMITLVSGDADYVPAIKILKARGFKVEVCFWDHASREIREAATRFVSLNKYLDHLNLKRT